jgi:hypothetical protein
MLMGAEEYPVLVLLLNEKMIALSFEYQLLQRVLFPMICFANIVVQTIFYKRNTIPTILHTIGPFFHFYHCSEATDGMFIFQ